MRELYAERPRRDETPLAAYSLTVGDGFLEALDIELLAGRDFQPEDIAKIRGGEFTPTLINETAAEAFGWDDPIGQEFGCCMSPTPVVVGVVKDFHYQSLKEAIVPTALMHFWWSRFVLVRVRTDDLAATLDFIENQWDAQAPGYPFEYTFMDDQFAQIYGAEERLARVFRLFALLAIAIACLGLFGLAAFMAEQRTKEIGIRKVLGASVPAVVLLLGRHLVALVVAAAVVALPLAYWGAERWLRDFAYRIEPGVGLLLGAGVLTLAVALVAVGYQTVKAARTNPADSLRYE
jgi:putative ABC transport system permease protein